MGVDQLITENLDLWTSSIKVKKTQGRGSSKKQELYGVNKLRELILGLALSGLLCDSEGEFSRDIEDLLLEARNKYIKRTNRTLKNYSFGKPLINEFKIPSNWKWMRIGQLCDLQTGATPSRRRPEYFGGKIPWLVSGDINKEIIEECDGRITEEGLAASNCKILPEKTVLIALNGQGKTRATVALMKISASCNQSLVGMIPFESELLDSSFLKLALKYRYFEIRDITGQKQRRGLNMGLVAELSLPVPPINIQKSIVAKVDELMALCDQLEQQTEASLEAHKLLVDTLLPTLTDAHDANELSDNWARLAERFDTLITTDYAVEKLKQTILQLAVMGKLVPQDPSDEPASELLKRIAIEKELLIEDKKIKKQKPLPEIADKEKIFKLPVSWQWSRMDDICFGITSGSTPPKNEFDDLTGAPYLKVYNIRDQFVDFEYKSQFVNTDYHSTKLKRSILYPGDVIMNIVGPPLGKVAIIPDTYSEWNCNQAITFFRPIIKDFNRYIYTYIKAGVFLQSIDLIGTAGQDNISVTKSRSIALPVPPLEEQQRIVAKVEQLMELCSQLKIQINDTQITQLDLANAVVETAVN